MFTRKGAITLLLLCVCAAFAAAQPVDFTLRQTGTVLGAYTSVGDQTYMASASITPFLAENGREGYYVSWRVRQLIQDPPYVEMIVEAGGILADSAVKPLERANVLSVDLDIASLEEPRMTAVRCTPEWRCDPFTAGAFPLKGTFTPMSGVGSSSTRRSGNQQIRNIDFVCTVTQSLIGTEEAQAARFQGVIGTVTVVAYPYTPNGQVQRHRGQLRIVQECQPLPPPPPPPPDL